MAYESPEYLDLSELNAVHDFEMSDLSDGIDSAMADSRLKVTAGTGYIALSADETVNVTVADLAGRTVASLPAFTGDTPEFLRAAAGAVFMMISTNRCGVSKGSGGAFQRNRRSVGTLHGASACNKGSDAFK